MSDDDDRRSCGLYILAAATIISADWVVPHNGWAFGLLGVCVFLMLWQLRRG